MSCARDPDAYEVLEDGPEMELKVKGSRFVGQAYAAGNPATAQALLETVRRRYRDASHHCWAWRLGEPPTAQERTDDDGEPLGCAGPPILAVAPPELSNFLVVVTRWFGGTKLGKGGLIRAYGDTARLAFEAAPRRRMWKELFLEVGCGYPDVGAVEAVLARRQAALVEVRRSFAQTPVFAVRVRQSQATGLAEELREGTKGRARLHFG